MAKSKALSRPAAALAPPSEKVKLKPLYYLAAFLAPALLTLIAYAIFGVYPFGERSVLCLDLNGQYVYYFENIRNAFWSGENLLYSWARNLSGGYQGVIGYYLASPFTFIVILLPRAMIIESLMIMQLAKIGTCGLTFCIYAQKSKGVKPLPSVIFATMYALMAYVVIQTIDPMWLDGPAFLPLIILGVEYLVDDGRKINYIIPLALMFIANFYIGFMIAIFVAVYFVFYLFFGTQKKMKLFDYVSTIGRMILATAVVLMCSYIMIMPIYNALALGKFDFSEPDYSLRTMFNPIELLATLLPNQYYSVNVDEGTRMYGRPEIYCGVMTLVLVPLYFFNKNIKVNRKIGYSMMIFVLFFSMWIKPINMMWHGGQDPNWLPYRYSFLVSFVLVSMAAETFSNLTNYKLNIKYPAGVFAGIGILTYAFNQTMDFFKKNADKLSDLDGFFKFFIYNEDKYKYVAKVPYKTTETINGKSVEHIWLGTLAFGLALAAIYLTLIYLYSHAKKKSQRNITAGIMAAFVLFEAGYNTFDTILKVDKEVYYSSRPSYTTIMDAPGMRKNLENYDDGFYRAEKTFFRNVNDNQAYGLKGLSHSSSVMNARIIRFLETLGYSTKSYETRYDGNTPIADSLLGIKYVLDDPQTRSDYNRKSLLSPYYNEVYTQDFHIENGERVLHVYENPDALPIGFMANSDILRLSFLGNDNPFNSMNNFLSSMTGNTTDYTELNPVSYFKRIAYGPYTVCTVGTDYDPMAEKNTDPSQYEVVLNECWESDYGGQHCYNANAGAGDPTVRIHITTDDTSDSLYMFLKSDNPKKCNLWVSDYKNPETGEFDNFKGYGSYFEDYDYSIVNLGSYPPNTELEIRLTILQTAEKTGANEYIMVKDFQFYQFDYDTFHNDISVLKENPWNLDLDKCDSNYLVGEIDAEEGQVFYTSIPYEPGWTIKVDGKVIEDAFYLKTENNVMVNDPEMDNGSVVVLNALIGAKLEPGHHKIEMKYTPPGFSMGVFLLILGVMTVIMLYMYDRKHNPVLLQLSKAKNTPPEEPKEKVKIIKSKGAVADVDLKSADSEKEEASETEEEAESSESSEDETEDDGEKAVFTDEDLKNIDLNAVNDAPKPKNKNKNKKKKKK